MIYKVRGRQLKIQDEKSIAKICQDYQAGRSMQEIGDDYFVDEQTISRIFFGFGDETVYECQICLSLSDELRPAQDCCKELVSPKHPIAPVVKNSAKLKPSGKIDPFASRSKNYANWVAGAKRG